MKIRKKRKVSKVVFWVIGLVLFFTLLIFNFYNKSINPKVVEVAEIKLKKITESFLSNNVGYGILKNTDMDNILVINKNENGEILYVNYNLDKAYQVLDVVTNELNSLIENLEMGKFENINDNNIVASDRGLVLKVPLMIASNNAFLSNLGPYVYLKVNFVGSLLTNIKSKITDYGMNNALVELYVTIKITEELISPVTKNLLDYEYDVLVASKVINGRVPEYYGGAIYAKSNLLSIPIE